MFEAFLLASENNEIDIWTADNDMKRYATGSISEVFLACIYECKKTLCIYLNSTIKLWEWITDNEWAVYIAYAKSEGWFTTVGS